MSCGPKIAASNNFNASSAIVELLDAFWAQKGALPDAVSRILQAGQGITPTLARVVPTVPDATRSMLLDRLTKIADFRYFKDPPATAQAVALVVSVHDDRLTPDERTAYNRLYDAFSRGGDPEAFLRSVEMLLGGYPAVRTLLDGAKTFVRPTPVVNRGVSATAKGSAGKRRRRSEQRRYVLRGRRLDEHPYGFTQAALDWGKANCTREAADSLRR